MSTTPLLWKAETQVNTADAPVAPGGTNVQSEGHIIALYDGPYAIVWVDGSRTHDPNGTAIVGQLFDGEGSPVGGEERITDIAGPHAQLSVAELENNGIGVAFATPGGGGSDIYVQRLHADLSPAGLDAIDTGDSTTSSPAIAGFDGGGYAVAYVLGSGAHTDIVGRVVSAAGVVGAEFAIHDENDNSGNVELVTLRNENFVAVYQDEYLGDAANTQIRYRLFTPNGTPVGASHDVPGGNGSGAETDPAVTAYHDGEYFDADTGFVVVWTEQNGDASGEGIRATMFDDEGAVVRSDFLVNTTQAGNQNEASVVAFQQGGFLVTWEDDFADVVRAQRFDASGNTVGREFTVRQGVSAGSPEAATLDGDRIVFAVDKEAASDVDVVSSIYDPDPPFWPHDVVWQHAEGSPAVDGDVLANVSNSWRILAAGDFDGDHDGDILWRHTSGQVITWEMNGTDHVSNHSLGSVSNSWQMRGTGDFDGDGDADILWHHDGGQVVTWEMEDGDYVATHNHGSVPNSWQVRGTGDFDGDGDADILWRHSGGQTVTWEMENGAYVVNHNLGNVSNSWQLRGAGDFDGDGDADILWHHDAGQVVTWEMQGGGYVTNHNLASVSNSWQVQGAYDFDSDGDADILWRHDTGRIATWEIEDNALLVAEDHGVVPNGWLIRGIGEFDLA